MAKRPPSAPPPPIGVRVDIVRSRQGVSRTELAELLGVDRSTVTKWATTGSAPRDIEAVARALATTVAEIFAARPDKRRAA